MPAVEASGDPPATHRTRAAASRARWIACALCLALLTADPAGAKPRRRAEEPPASEEEARPQEEPPDEDEPPPEDGAGATGEPPTRAADPAPGRGIDPGAPAPPRGWAERVRGWIGTEYRLRFTGSESDQDLVSVLGLDLGDAERDAVTAHVLARGSADLDGDRDGDSPFVSITDSFDHARNGRLYEAYLDFHRADPLDVLRVGRQTVEDAPIVAHVDGVRVETEPRGDLQWRVGGYGGIPAHLFESSNDGDWILGSFGELRPWKGGRVRVDWLAARDDARLGTNRENLLGFRFWQRITQRFDLHGLYTRQDGDERDLRIRGTYADADRDLVVKATYYRLLQKRTESALEFDPFSQSLLTYFPYNEITAQASKGFGDHVVVDAGVTARQLDDESDEGDFNREFERYYLTPSVTGIPLDGLTASVTFEQWDAGDREIVTYGFDLTHEIRAGLEGSIGSYYSLFKFDLFTGGEQDDVRTYYLRFDYRLSDAWRFDASYEYEDDDFDEFSTLRIGARWQF